MPENDYVLYPLGFLQSPLKEPHPFLTSSHALERGFKLLKLNE
jgi:hypothetical protein